MDLLGEHRPRIGEALALRWANVDLATAAAIMGHKNASVLLDVYAQVLRAPKLAAVRMLEGALYSDRPDETAGG